MFLLLAPWEPKHRSTPIPAAGFPSDLETDSNFVSSLLPVSLRRLLALCLGWKWLGSSLSDLEGAGMPGRVKKGECSGGCLSRVSEKGT